MSHAFQPISSAKSTFKELKEPQYASDYITNKKAHISYCNNNCKKISTLCKKKWSEGDYLLYKKGRDAKLSILLGTTFDTTELYGGLMTYEDLMDVSVIQNNITSDSPTLIHPLNVPFYQYYNIDPNGVLFGNTPCGVNNYVKFMEPM